ncbi:hypothetical protein CDL12_20755 [Handroanthus impetiginosus]|uniref:Transcription repressor n=1 Tax=Handroanthus impetiginosus TaxID=429701 RepID=A0A2G9GNA3_9LAMI|nr:hypothetical protein CDL12_20755 [Handroanthus impetiginosus]
MKWGRRKSSPSSSPSSIINRVFSVSWFSKLKQKGGNLETGSSKNKKRSEFDFPTPISDCREGRFYSMDEDDAYWRLSFGEERVQGRRSTGGINPLWYDLDHDFQASVSSFKRQMEEPISQERRNFNDMVLDIKKMREKQRKQKTATENGDAFRSKREINEFKFSNSAERDIFPIEPHKMVPIAVSKEDYVLEPHIAASERVSTYQWQNVEQKKYKEIKVRPEPIPKSRESHIRKLKQKSYSPRTECKIRALEEIKKARMKSKKKMEKKEQMLEGKTIFDSFAVVKSSFNPQKDFRDSMVEMIREKGIEHPQELEELLACYLTLNRDEYHDLIIKVFRKVWYELNGHSQM